MTPRRGAVVCIASAAVLVLSGCASQLAAIAPVGGGDVTALRIATIDVLQDLGIGMMQVPVCVEADEPVDSYVCAGTTTDGKAIAVTSPGTTPMTMTILVDDKQVFAGSVREVIDKAAGEVG